MIGFTTNLIILISMICSKYLMRSPDVYICLICSLVSSDTITSLFMAVQLLCGSYLPVVKEISPPNCLLLAVECLRKVTRMERRNGRKIPINSGIGKNMEISFFSLSFFLRP